MTEQPATEFTTVFHVPERDPAYGKRAFRNVQNLLDDETADSDVTVVCNSGGIDHLLASAPTAEQVQELLEAGVTIYACRNSMGEEVSRSDLVDGVEVVPTAMGELSRRQAAGDSYIRP